MEKEKGGGERPELRYWKVTEGYATLSTAQV